MAAAFNNTFIGYEEVGEQFWAMTVSMIPRTKPRDLSSEVSGTDFVQDWGPSSQILENLGVNIRTNFVGADNADGYIDEARPTSHCNVMSL